MSAPLVCAALFVLVLTVARWCQIRIEREFGEGPLSVGTVRLVCILYTLQIAFVAVPLIGAWGSLPGPLLLWRALGFLVVGLGLALGAWGVALFHSFRGMTGRGTSDLITAGAYRYSRSPQNVGIGLALVGIAILGLSSIGLAAAANFWVMFRAYVPIEERFLESTYGDRYRAYRAGSRRYFRLRRMQGHDAAA